MDDQETTHSTLTIDWDSGEGAVRLGAAFGKAPARFRYDVLADWKDQIDRLFATVEAELYPDKRDQLAHFQVSLKKM